MLSSTSSFERDIPNKNFKWNVVGSVALAFILLVSWEGYCRYRGYEPTVNDNADLWVVERRKLDERPDAHVIIGASRILFGLDLDIYEQAFKTKPIQLSTIGVNAGIYLEHLADDPSFKGRVLVGYAPGLFFANGGGPIKSPQDNIRRYHDMTLSDQVDFHIAKIFDNQLAFVQPDDLTLKQMLARLPLENRDGTVLPPKLPPYFYYVDMRRQGALAKKVEQDPALARHIEDIWLGLMAPHDTHLPEAVRKENEAANIQKTIDRTVASVKKIRAKGGDVVFVQYPSSGRVRDLEHVLTPRDRYWEPLIKAAGVHAVHFEDHEALKHFHCPEGGHLTQEDRGKFTEGLVPLLQQIYAKIDADKDLLYASEEQKRDANRSL